MRDREEFDSKDLEPRKGRRSPLPLVVVVAAGAVLVLVLAAFFFIEKDEPEAPPPVRAPAAEAPAFPPEPVVEAPPVEQAEPSPEPPSPVAFLPVLDESDDLVRRIAEGMAGGVIPASWLAPDDLIRRFVVMVDNIAEGYSPRSHLTSVKIKGEFAVLEREGRLYLDPGSYRRYDGLTGILSSLDAADLARAYGELSPLFQEAYRDLGYPDRSFDETMRIAIRRLLEAPVLEGSILLIRGEKAYHFEDPVIEGLGAGEKHLLRMGPENTIKIQAVLRAFAEAL